MLFYKTRPLLFPIRFFQEEDIFRAQKKGRSTCFGTNLTKEKNKTTQKTTATPAIHIHGTSTNTPRVVVVETDVVARVLGVLGSRRRDVLVGSIGRFYRSRFVVVVGGGRHISSSSPFCVPIGVERSDGRKRTTKTTTTENATATIQ